MSVISIEQMKFYAHHGCFEEERTIGTYFTVSISFETDTSKAEQTDEITDTVDYSAVYTVIKREMAKPSHLLEYVGRRIIDAVKQEFPVIDNITLKLSKMNPPIGGNMDCVSITLQG